MWKKDIMACLQKSKVDGNTVGIILKDRTFLITAVEAFVEDQQVVLKNTTLYGEPITTCKLHLHDIESVMLFATLFEEEEFKRMRLSRMNQIANH